MALATAPIMLPNPHCRIASIRPLAGAPRGPILAFDAGKSERRLRGLTRSTVQINALIRRYGKTVLARSRYLAQNDSYAAQAKETFTSALVGTGIKPSPQIEDADLKKAVAQAWLDWTDESDADGLTDFYGQQAIMAAEMFEAGECFVRMRARRPEDGLSVPLQLQILPSEMLPSELNIDMGAQGRVECGIQFGPIGQRVAYWFLTRHPGSDVFPINTNPAYYTIVPAAEVLHLFRPLGAGQVRGVPHTLSGIVSAAMLNADDDATLEGHRIAALFSAFVTLPNNPNAAEGDDPLAGGDPTPPPSSGREPTGDTPMQPGATIYLDQGEEVKFAEPKDVGSNYELFQYRQLTRMAAGFGIPYADMTGDLRQTSYGSQRGGMISFRRRIEPMQHGVMVFQMCRPIYRRWLDDAVLAGAVPIKASGYMAAQRVLQRAKWITPAWAWIDPLKDITAERMAIDIGLTSRDDSIEARGDEPEEIDRRIAAGQKRAADLGISFNVTPRGGSSISVSDEPPAPVSAPETGASPQPTDAAAA